METISNEEKKCEKCGKVMKKSGPYAHRKDEGEPAYRGSDKVFYCCMNEKCDNFYKNIEEIER